MKLLIVDDDNDDVILARVALNGTDIEVIQAANSQTAITEIKNSGAVFCLIDYSFAESNRMVDLCAQYSLPSIFWSGMKFGKHRMIMTKDLLLAGGAGFRKRLFELIQESSTQPS